MSGLGMEDTGLRGRHNAVLTGCGKVASAGQKSGGNHSEGRLTNRTRVKNQREQESWFCSWAFMLQCMRTSTRLTES